MPSPPSLLRSPISPNSPFSPQPNAMPEIRNVRSTVNSPMTNTFSAQFSERDPNSLSIEEILGSCTSEIKIDAVRLELEEAVSARVEEEQPRCASSYFQYPSSISIDEILQFIPEREDVEAVISELTADPLPQSGASGSTTPNWRVSQEVDAPAASRAVEGAVRVLAYNSPVGLSRLSFYGTLPPISNEHETMKLDYVINGKEKMYFIFKLDFKLEVRSRAMKVRKVSFQAEDKTYVFTPPFSLYKKHKTLHLSILKKNLPPDDKYIVTILYSINNISKITKRPERKDTTLTSSFLSVKADLKIIACNRFEIYSSDLKINDASGQ